MHDCPEREPEGKMHVGLKRGGGGLSVFLQQNDFLL